MKGHEQSKARFIQLILQPELQWTSMDSTQQEEANTANPEILGHTSVGYTQW